MNDGCDCVRTFNVGGLTKSELLKELHRQSILMNVLAERLFASDGFMTSETPYSITTVELTVRDLGLFDGGTWEEIQRKAERFGLSPCPLEVGPHMRLQYRDQAEGHVGKPVRSHRAPYGSITIASEIIPEVTDSVTGFYLRCIEGRLWLRGYYSPAQHVWDADDHIVFLGART